MSLGVSSAYSHVFQYLELIMNLSAAYLQKRSEWKEEGVYKVARNLLRQGMSIELVAQVTELTIDRVKELRDRL